MLHRCRLRASAVDEGSLEAGEGDLINELFTAAGSGGFPSYEHVLGDKATDGGGGVAERGGGLLHGDATGGGKGIYEVGFTIYDLGVSCADS